MVIFIFIFIFKMAAVHHLGRVMRMFEPPTKIFGCFNIVQNMVEWIHLFRYYDSFVYSAILI